MGYRKIAKHLNASGIKTSRGNEFKNTHVYSVLKRYREREERIKTVMRRLGTGGKPLGFLNPWLCGSPDAATCRTP